MEKQKKANWVYEIFNPFTVLIFLLVVIFYGAMVYFDRLFFLLSYNYQLATVRHSESLVKQLLTSPWWIYPASMILLKHYTKSH